MTNFKCDLREMIILPYRTLPEIDGLEVSFCARWFSVSKQNKNLISVCFVFVVVSIQIYLKLVFLGVLLSPWQYKNRVVLVWRLNCHGSERLDFSHLFRFLLYWCRYRLRGYSQFNRNAPDHRSFPKIFEHLANSGSTRPEVKLIRSNQ